MTLWKNPVFKSTKGKFGETGGNEQYKYPLTVVEYCQYASKRREAERIEADRIEAERREAERIERERKEKEEEEKIIKNYTIKKMWVYPLL